MLQSTRIFDFCTVPQSRTLQTLTRSLSDVCSLLFCASIKIVLIETINANGNIGAVFSILRKTLVVLWKYLNHEFYSRWSPRRFVYCCTEFCSRDRFRSRDCLRYRYRRYHNVSLWLDRFCRTTIDSRVRQSSFPIGNFSRYCFLLFVPIWCFIYSMNSSESTPTENKRRRTAARYQTNLDSTVKSGLFNATIVCYYDPKRYLKTRAADQLTIASLLSVERTTGYGPFWFFENRFVNGNIYST